MIHGITVMRSNPSTAICDPVQWSSGLQLAINNGFSLSVFEPILPSIHKSIIPLNSNQTTTLDTKSLFSITNVIHSDVISTWNLRKFYGVNVTTNDEQLQFGKFAEAPIITSHQWSPISLKTKNCQIAVLLNTSELIILERSSMVSDYYEIKWNVFELLVEDLKLPDSSFSEKGELLLTNDQFLSLKVNSFCYSSSFNLCLATANLRISIYNEEMLKVLEFGGNDEFEGRNITKLSWSQYKSISNTEKVSKLAVFTDRNEIYLLFIHENDQEISVSDVKKIKSASRFLISQVKWYNPDVLFFGSTKSLNVYDSTANETRSHTLGKCDLITGIITEDSEVLALESLNSILIYVSFEFGGIESVLYDLKSIQFIPSSSINSPLQQLPKILLYKYQLSRSESVDETSSTSNYLSSEGTLFNYGCKLNGSVVAYVSRINPKNTINYAILSKVEYKIDFIPIIKVFSKDNSTDFKGISKKDTKQTAISWINRYWFNHYTDVPHIKVINDVNINSYCGEIEKFINTNFVLDTSESLSVTTSDSISDWFTLNPMVFKLQVKYNFLIIILKTLRVLNDMSENEKVKNCIKNIETQKLESQNRLFKLLGEVISAIKIEDAQSYDKYIQESYTVLLGKDIASRADPSEISISTPFISESFYSDGTSRDIISSLTNHKWKRCNVTLFPILQLNHKTSEIGEFNYILDDFDQSYKLCKDILKNLNYCVFSGNRAFKKR